MRRGEGRGEDFWGYMKVKMRRWMRLLYTIDRPGIDVTAFPLASTDHVSVSGRCN